MWVTRKPRPWCPSMSKGKKQPRRFTVLAVGPRGRARLVRWHREKKKFTLSRDAKHRVRLTAGEAEKAAKWAKRRPTVSWTRVSDGRFPFVSLADGARPCNDDLMKRLNQVGKGIQKRVHIVSGDRNPYEAWRLRQGWVHRRPGFNLAARCCSKYSGGHSWSSCGKDPWSNHARGQAADCGVLDPNYRSIGYHAGARKWLRKLDCALVVPGEKWHVERARGRAWRS